MKEIGISEFKAKCIDELKKVQRTGEPLLVTLDKRPIATVNPYREESHSNRELGKLRGRMTIHGDIVHTDFGDEWEILLDTHVWIWSQESPEQLGPDARDTVADEANALLVSTTSPLEIARLVWGGRLAIRIAQCTACRNRSPHPRDRHCGL